jgi:D-alanine--poly(phosphoribitol) ligase subunit 2
MSSDERIAQAIDRAIDAFNEQLPEARRLAKSPQTVLFGKSGRLDSLGLVSFIVEVEQQVEEELGITISLADERAMSQQKSPFMTIQSLSDYVSLLVEENGIGSQQ